MLTLNQMQVNSKWIKDLNTRDKTLIKKCKKSFMTSDLTIISWDTTEEPAVKEDTNKLNYIKIKINYVSEGTTVKLQPKRWGKNCKSNKVIQTT